jgi:hypothetical protein
MVLGAAFALSCGAGSGPAAYDQAGFCRAVVAAWGDCCGGTLDDVGCRQRFFRPVTDGVAEVSSGDADECRSGYERAASDCDGLTETERAACEDMLVGHVATGEACADPRLCAQGAVCVDGVCRDEGERGDGCVPFSCAPGLYCNVDEGICRDLRGENDACENGDEAQCRSDLRCVDGHCGSGLPDSAPCTSSAECQSLSCDADRCAPTPAPTFCE